LQRIQSVVLEYMDSGPVVRERIMATRACEGRGVFTSSRQDAEGKEETRDQYNLEKHISSDPLLPERLYFPKFPEPS
jgi:hypothetical protein